MKIHLLLLAALFFSTVLLAENEFVHKKGEVVFFDGLAGNTGWSALSGATFENGVMTVKAGDGVTGVNDETLARNVFGQDEKGGRSKNYVISRGIMKHMTSIKGYLIEVSVEIKSQGVPWPDATWEGVRFAVNYATETVDFTDCYYGIQGDFGWKKFKFITRVPGDVRDMSVTLGILGYSGEASFRNLAFTVVDLPRSAYFATENGEARKGNNLGRLRGFNSQNGVITYLRPVADKWNANVFKSRSGLPKELLSDAELDRWLEENIYRQWDKVPAAAAAAGTLYILELSPAPWRARNDRVSMTEFQYYKPGYADYLVKIWEKITLRYKGVKSIYGFELLNESCRRLEKQDGFPDYEEMMERIARAINAIDPERTVIIQPEEYWGTRSFGRMRPIQARNVVYAPHFYAPFTYTHQRISGNAYPVHYPGNIKRREWNKEMLRRDLQEVRDFQKAYTVPILVSEFGVVAAAPGRELWLKDVIELFEEYDWDWMFHAIEEWWGWRPDWVLNDTLPFDPKRWSEKEFWREDPAAPSARVLREYMAENRRPERVVEAEKPPVRNINYPESAVSIRCDIMGGETMLEPGKSATAGKIAAASWLKGEAAKRYLIFEQKLAPGNKWQNFEFSFAPESSGKVTLILTGQWYTFEGQTKPVPTWTCYDNIQITGSENAGNASFEELSNGGNPIGWGLGRKLVRNVNGAADGENYIMTALNIHCVRTLDVTAGQVVTVAGVARRAMETDFSVK